jgi:isopentenyl diphosphate isomerase/L-lactate dehydrogenase-like FMN-dependent dehydrogenase
MSDPSRESSPGIARQMAIFQGKLAGETPEHPVAVEELEDLARAALPREAFDYLAGGAGSEDTMRANLAAFRRYRLVPRLLRDVDRRDLGVTLLGRTLPLPVLLAPIGVQGAFHRDGELATARAARLLEIPFVVSTVSSRPLEEIAAAMGDAPRWFQLYWPRSDELAGSLLARAEKAGFQAVVVTLDTYLLAWRERDLRNAYLPFLHGEGMANYLSDPVFRAAVGVDPRQDPRRALEYFAQVFSDPSRTWADLGRLRKYTSLPILLKGILHPDDARRAVDHGADGLIVSNHGGRQLDGALAALDALPRVVKAVGDKTPVLFDSGIRRGADAIKAMALGARAVLLGRPYAYGLAVAGERGVREVVLNLRADLDLTLGLIGCASFGELGPDHIEVVEPLAGFP